MNLSVRPQACDRRFVILAPYLAEVPATFGDTILNPQMHRSLLADMQRLRGNVYLQDGAVQPYQLEDGRHKLPVDQRSWHVLTLGSDGRVCACSRYLTHPKTAAFHGLELVKSAVAQSEPWGKLLQTAVGADLALARQRRIQFVEVGGWALAPQVRCTTEAIRVALGTYALAQLLGGCIGVTTATHRNGSASILKRIGGTGIHVGDQHLPPYFDPQFGCYMEVIRFDSQRPSATFDGIVQKLRCELARVQVVCAQQENPLAARAIPMMPPPRSIVATSQSAFA